MLEGLRVACLWADVASPFLGQGLERGLDTDGKSPSMFLTVVMYAVLLLLYACGNYLFK